jgi:hypothetical protein
MKQLADFNNPVFDFIMLLKILYVIIHNHLVLKSSPEHTGLHKNTIYSQSKKALKW